LKIVLGDAQEEVGERVAGAVGAGEPKVTVDEVIVNSVVLIGGNAPAKFPGVAAMNVAERIDEAKGVVG